MMLTTDVIREVFADIVGKLKTSVSFELETNKVLDDKGDKKFPVCIWLLPDASIVQSSQILQPSYVLDMFFLEQTGSDRTPLQMNDAHARMHAIASQVFEEFFNRYIASEGNWQGLPVELSLQGPVVLNPVWDQGPKMLTGVHLGATVLSTSKIDCKEIYFNYA